MNLVVWLIVGGLMGCLASLPVPVDGHRRVATNMLVGIAGSLVGGWLLSPFIGGSTADQIEFSRVALIVSLACSPALLATGYLARREMAR